MRKLLFLFLIYSAGIRLSAQQSITGKVLDDSTKLPLAYVNIGIPKANVGCTTNEMGLFTLKLPDSLKLEKVRFQHIGYKQKDIKVSELLNTENTVLLKPEVLELASVQITSTKPKRKTKGIKARNPLLQGSVGIGEVDIIELAQEFKLKRENCQLIDFNIFFKCWPEKVPEVKYRIKVYESIEGVPGKLLSKQRILKTGVVRGWNRINLEEYGIYTNENIFVSIEFLPLSDEKDFNIYTGGIMAAGNRWARKASFGEWEPSTGGYTMYVTYEF